MKKYCQFFKTYLLVSTAYKVDIFGTIIRELIRLFAILILWNAIFSSQQLSGIDFNRMLVYFISIPLAGFPSHISVSTSLGYEIKRGELSNYLVKPVNIWIEKMLKSFAFKLNYLFTVAPFYLIILIFFFPRDVSLSAVNIFVALFWAFFGFLLNFFLDMLVADLAFWFDEVWAFQHFKSITFSIFGGILLPFEFLGRLLRVIFNMLPFKYFYYIPASYFIGIRSIDKFLVKDVIVYILWLVLFICLYKLLWRSGVKRYEAFGN